MTTQDIIAGAMVAVNDKNGKRIATLFPKLTGSNVITTSARYANDFSRMNKLCELFGNNLAVVIRTGRVCNAKRNTYPRPATTEYTYRLPLTDCPDCDGTGNFDGKVCPTCSGDGH